MRRMFGCAIRPLLPELPYKRTVSSRPDPAAAWSGRPDGFSEGTADRSRPCGQTDPQTSTLNTECNVAILIDRPVRIPGYLPRMIVRIGHISSKTTVRRGVCRPDDTPTCLDEQVDCAFDRRSARDIVPQRKGAGRQKTGAVHIRLKGRLLERAEYKAVHLVEDDLFILKDGRPSKSLNIKSAGPLQISDAERDDGNLVLHIQAFHSLPHHFASVPGLGTRRRSEGQGPLLRGSG